MTKPLFAVETIRLAFPASALALLAIASGFVALAASYGSPGGGSPIAPPPGWLFYKGSSSDALIWRQPGYAAFRQNIVVTRQATRLTAATFDAGQVDVLEKAVPGFKLGSFQDGVVCNQPGHYFSYAGIANGQTFIAEHMTLVRGDYAWSAQYTRLASQQTSAAARKSLTTLCGSDLSPGAAMRTTKAPTAVRTQPPSPEIALPTQQPAGSVAPTVTPRFGP